LENNHLKKRLRNKQRRLGMM